MDSNETISGNRPGKDKVLKDIVSETQIYRRIYKDMRGFGRIHKARYTYNQVYDINIDALQTVGSKPGCCHLGWLR